MSDLQIMLAISLWGVVMFGIALWVIQRQKLSKLPYIILLIIQGFVLIMFYDLLYGGSTGGSDPAGNGMAKGLGFAYGLMFQTVLSIVTFITVLIQFMRKQMKR